MPIRETRRLKYKDKGDSLKFASCAIVCSMYDFDSKKKSQLRSSKLAPNKIKIEIFKNDNVDMFKYFSMFMKLCAKLKK